MKAHMTNGTLEFVKKIMDNHPEINFYLMNSGNGTLAYYENENDSIFESGRSYEVLITNGTIQDKGFVVMNNITVTEDGQTPFEERFKQRSSAIDSTPGFQAFRLLRPQKGNTYIVFTQWATIDDFDKWKNSDAFKKQHQQSQNETKPPAYFADRPFITTYNMVDPD